MGVGVMFFGFAVGGPASVTNANCSGNLPIRELLLQVLQFAFGANPVDLVLPEGGDTGGVIAAIFEFA